MNRIRIFIATATLTGLVAGAAGLVLGSSGHGDQAMAASSPSVAAVQPDVDATAVERMIHRPGQQIAGADTGTWSSMDDFMTWVEQDAASVWNWYYKQWGYTITSDVRVVFSLPGQSVVTGCGNTTNDNTMEYCSLDDTIYFSQSIATRLWNGTFVGPDGQRFTRQGGDFAVAMLLAHEYGHNVQTELNVFGRYTVPQQEKMADCLSGTFAQVAYYQNVLDPNDVNEAIASAFMVGDSAFNSADHHGTPAERVEAWKLGYNSTTGPAACWSYLR